MIPAAEKIGLAAIRPEQFTGRIGEHFHFRPSVTPGLLAVLELMLVTEGPACFSLLFRSPVDQGFLSEICDLEHESFHDCGILLTRVQPPRGLPRDTAYYEAVFA